MNEFEGITSFMNPDHVAQPEVATEAARITGDDVRRVLDDLWRGPLLPFSFWRKPGSRMYAAQPRRIPATTWLDRQCRETAWQRAGHSAWIESVRDKLQSAVYATDQGWSWTWDAPGTYVRPDIPNWLMVRDFGPPCYKPEVER